MNRVFEVTFKLSGVNHSDELQKMSNILSDEGFEVKIVSFSEYYNGMIVDKHATKRLNEVHQTKDATGRGAAFV